jgi:hypothetical protein
MPAVDSAGFSIAAYIAALALSAGAADAEPGFAWMADSFGHRSAEGKGPCYRQDGQIG